MGLSIDMKRNDGYQVGGLTIQGVRAYDPGAAQWTSPDAYKGDVHDPMSQKPYTWNGNNPIQYSDPSGYVLGADDAVEATAAVVVGGGELLAEGTAAVEAAVGDTAGAAGIRSAVNGFNRTAWQTLEKGGDWAKGRFQNALGNTRIADDLRPGSGTVGEAKSVSYQAFTKQLKDYLNFAQQNNLKFILRVWEGTKLSEPLQDAISTGKIILQEIPKK